MKYRAEIDGLRALAVVPVILFHAGFDITQGQCSPLQGDDPLLTDYGHLNKAGAREFGAQLLQDGIFARML